MDKLNEEKRDFWWQSAMKFMVTCLKWREELHRRFGRFSIIFPLLSMCWGIVSATFLTRDYAHSSYLAASLGGLIGISIFLKLWFQGLGEQWAKRWEAKLANAPETSKAKFIKKILGHLSKPHIVENFALQVNQTCIQYITMFCIPLLYAAESWGTLAITTVIAATTLWDQWWIILAKKSWYTATIRGVAGLLAISYSFAVLFPKEFHHFYPVIAATTFFAVLPWSAFFPFRAPTFQEIAVVVVVLGAIGIQFFVGEWIRVPVLSVWVRKPSIGLMSLGASLSEKWPRRVSKARLEESLLNGSPLCCLTPVVSPSGMIAKVAHEWLINDTRVDYIPLGRIRTTEKTEFLPYKTYSCKQNFNLSVEIKTIECRVYLDDTVDIGGALIKIKN